MKDHSKAVAKEHKLAEKMNAVVHKHDEALSKENKLAAVSHVFSALIHMLKSHLQDIQARDQYHAKVEAELAAKKRAVEQVTQRASTNSLSQAFGLTCLPHSTTSTTLNEKRDITSSSNPTLQRLRLSPPTRSVTMRRLRHTRGRPVMRTVRRVLVLRRWALRRMPVLLRGALRRILVPCPCRRGTERKQRWRLLSCLSFTFRCSCFMTCLYNIAYPLSEES